jgi:hypothetical protein
LRDKRINSLRSKDFRFTIPFPTRKSLAAAALNYYLFEELPRHAAALRASSLHDVAKSRGLRNVPNENR